MSWLIGNSSALGEVAAKAVRTDNDLFTQLRQRGVFSLDEVRYVLYETKGSITIVGDDVSSEPEPQLVQAGLQDAAGFP